jgi:hypothetical protein
MMTQDGILGLQVQYYDHSAARLLDLEQRIITAAWLQEASTKLLIGRQCDAGCQASILCAHAWMCTSCDVCFASLASLPRLGTAINGQPYQATPHRTIVPRQLVTTFERSTLDTRCTMDQHDHPTAWHVVLVLMNCTWQHYFRLRQRLKNHQHLLLDQHAEH